MSVEARVKAALGAFGDPVEKSVFTTPARDGPQRYYTFQCESLGADFGDDEPGSERWLVSIHLFAPPDENCVRRGRMTKRALFNAGFTWPQMTDASDQDGQHLVFECETVEGIPEMEVSDGTH